MFSRLNEAVPLNAAEKRNSIGGDLVTAIREVANHDFFLKKVAFGNKRYQHREVATRLLFIEETLKTVGKLIDTKKEYLDALAKNYKHGKSAEVVEIQDAVKSVLDFMISLFLEKDELLRAQGNMVLYYLLCKSAIHWKLTEKISREQLFAFKDIVQENRVKAEDNYAEASFELLEYDRMTQQGTNDASNIRERLRIIANFLGIPLILV
jgi:hypothetical protein